MFIGRRSELDFLEEKYRETNGNFILIYGRRRIGKTALVNEFIKKKESIYLFATQEERVQTIKKFSQKVSDFFSDTFMSGNPFQIGTHSSSIWHKASVPSFEDNNSD
jgi:Predicted ATPase (AAA+ superfamily)